MNRSTSNPTTTYIFHYTRTTVAMHLIKMAQLPQLKRTRPTEQITTHMAPIRMHNMDNKNNLMHVRPVVHVVYCVECAAVDFVVVPVS